MKTFTLAFAGDTSLGYAYIGRRPEHEDRLRNDPMSYFHGVLPVVRGADQFILNLETVLSTTPGTPIEGKQWPGLDDPETTIRVLKELGVTAVSMANNHAMDFGGAKLLETIDYLRKAGIEVFGAGGNIVEASRPYRFTLKGDHGSRNVHVIAQMRPSRRYIEYGFFASKTTPGINSTKIQRIGRQISQIRSKDPDALIIVCPHWQGLDYQPVKTKLKEYSRQLVDLGANLILAHGTHRADEIETYKGVTIAHSLGNFVFSSPGRYTAKGSPGVSLIASLEIVETSGEWGLATSFTPIHTNNRTNGFRSRPAVPSDLPPDSLGRITLDRLSFATTSHADIKGTPQRDDEPQPRKGLVVTRDLLASVPGYRGSNPDMPAPATGADYRLHYVEPGQYLVVTDEDWPPARRKQSRQAKLNLRQIIKKAEALDLAGLIIKDLPENRSAISKIPLVFCKDTREFLFNLAHAARAAYMGKVVAVTGSSGKSSTVRLISEAVRNLEQTSDQTINNQNKVYDNISHVTKFTPDTDVYVLEMCSANLKPTMNISRTVKPNVAVLTSVAPTHLEEFGSVKNVAITKAGIFDGLEQGGLALICRDIPYFELASDRARVSTNNILTYGVHSSSDLRLVSYDFSSGEVLASAKGTEIRYNMGQMGQHMVINSLAMIATLQAIGMDWRRAAKLAGNFVPTAGRGEVHEAVFHGRRIIVIDETYNANPDSMRATLKGLGMREPSADGRRIAVLGDMLELGEKSATYHTDLLDPVLESGVGRVYLIGKMMSHLWARLPDAIKGAYVSDLDQLASTLRSDLRENDIVFLKASNGIGLAAIVKTLTED